MNDDFKYMTDALFLMTNELSFSFEIRDEYTDQIFLRQIEDLISHGEVFYIFKIRQDIFSTICVFTEDYTWPSTGRRKHYK